jgi:hypothetical protein
MKFLSIFLAALAFIAICVFGMCFNILFRGKEFPKSDVGDNEEMRKRGIRCMNEIDKDIFGQKKKKGPASGCSGNYSSDCVGCGFYPRHSKQRGE